MSQGNQICRFSHLQLANRDFRVLPVFRSRTFFWSRQGIRLSCVVLAGLFLFSPGCRKPNGAGGNQSGQQDAFQAAAADAEDRAEVPFIEASRPILEAFAQRDYAKLFELTSPHALKHVSPEQFGTDSSVPGNAALAKSVDGMTKDQFVTALQAMEERLGKPYKVINLSIQTIDPNELAGKGDPIDNMFNIGAMSKDIPFEIRKASIRSQIGIRIPEKDVKQVAADLGVSEEDVRSGKAFVNMDFDSGDGPYMNVKLVLVEDGGLKIGYFEFMPPSMMD